MWWHTQEAEAGRINEFEDSQGSTEKPCLEKPKEKKREIMSGVVVHAFNSNTGGGRGSISLE